MTAHGPFAQYGLAAVVPVRREETTHGFIGLGDRASKKGYTDDELEFANLGLLQIAASRIGVSEDRNVASSRKVACLIHHHNVGKACHQRSGANRS